MTYDATLSPATATRAQAFNWADYLQPGERVMWQGRPDAGVHVTLSQAARVARAVLAIWLFFYILDRLWLQIPPFWDIRMIVLFVFFQAVPTEILLSVLRRRRSHYLLTDRRALIATEIPLTGTRLHARPIQPRMDVQLDHGRPFSSLSFGRGPRRFFNLLPPAASPAFERITDGPRLLNLLNAAR